LKRWKKQWPPVFWWLTKAENESLTANSKPIKERKQIMTNEIITLEVEEMEEVAAPGILVAD
jgi:hypothetical protein